MQSIAPAPIPQMHQQQEMSADNDLRAQLAAAIAPSGIQPGRSNPLPHVYNDPRASSASPHDQNIDPSMNTGGSEGMHNSGAGSGGGDSGGEDGAGGKGGKRELSQSKRAAQNRAAQRAFRQRKEGYIKKLEEQVREFHQLEDNFKQVQAENYSLREYIIQLQSRLIESQGELPPPPPPPNINLHLPGSHQTAVRHHEPTAISGPVAGGSTSTSQPSTAVSQLQATTARNIAAAGLQSGLTSAKHGQEEVQGPNKRLKSEEGRAADEEIIRAQLQGTTDQNSS